jgi:hypothetical protein
MFESQRTQLYKRQTTTANTEYAELKVKEVEEEKDHSAIAS